MLRSGGDATHQWRPKPSPMYGTPPAQPKALPSPFEGMLDMTQAETPKNIITKLGLEHKGITPASETKLGDDIHWFNDPETGSTLTMPGKRVTTESIVKHVEKSRKNFKVWKPLKQREDNHDRTNENAINILGARCFVYS